MKQNFKNILLQGWMFDCLDFMDNEEEQDKYLVALIRSALAGEVLTDNEKWVRFIEKALSSIEETRSKYHEKSQKNGMKGKEYGVLGKEYGVLGGRPTNEFKRVLNEITSDNDLVASIQNGTITKEEIDDMMERYDRKTLTNVLQWIKEKYNYKR